MEDKNKRILWICDVEWQKDKLVYKTEKKERK